MLHEDKRYYSSAADVYVSAEAQTNGCGLIQKQGEDVEALIQEEDAQPLTEPIIAPVKQRSYRLVDKSEKGPPTRYEKSFLLDLMNFPSSIRNVAVVGHLHHGKTSLMDMLVYETHQLDWSTDQQVCRLHAFVLSCLH